MAILRFAFFAQLVVMLSGFTVFLVTPPDFHTLGLMFYLVIIAGAAILFALWHFVRHRDRRGWAVATAATPAICLTAPFLITWLNGGPIHFVVLVGVVVAALIIAVFVLLARTTQWNADGIFANRRFNVGFLLALSMLLILYWLPITGWLYNQESFTLPRDISQRDAVLRILGIYFVSVAGPAFLLSFFALLFAPVGLVRNPGGRIVHGGQLLVALVSLASLMIGAFAISVATFNPG